MIKLENYSPEDAIRLMGCTPEQAAFNVATGPAYSFFTEGGELVGCGGVRIYGVGEAWLITGDKAKGEMKKTLLQTTANTMDKIVRDERLWTLIADSAKNGNFLEHIGFKKIEAYKWEAGQ